MEYSALVFDTAHNGTIHDARLDFYSRILATASSDGSIRLWDVSEEAPQFIAELKGHQAPVWQLAWSHPKFQNLLASCSYDHAIYIWKATGNQSWSIIYSSMDHTSSVNSVTFSPEQFGLNLAAASSDGTVSILSYRPETAWSRKVINAHSNGALAVSWCGAASSYNIRVWLYVESTDDWVLSHQMNTNKLHRQPVQDVAWNPVVQGFHVVASCSADGNVVIWTESENQQWKSKQVLSLGQPVWRVSWSVSGTILSVTSGVHKVQFYKEDINGMWQPFETHETAALETAAKGYKTDGNDGIEVN